MAGTVSHRPCSFLGDSRQKPFRSMLRSYHRLATLQALQGLFSPSALAEVIDANLAQDDLSNQLGSTPHYHFDNNRIAESEAYVEDQRRMVVQGPQEGLTPRVQRRAFGRLCHAVQDFYSHTNYVDLWLTMHGGTLGNYPNEIEPLEQAILADERLCSGTFYFWREPFYYIPYLGPLLRRIYCPADSHEAMHLDSPKRNPYFEYAFVAAAKRTRHEYFRIASVLTDEQLQRFQAVM